MINTLKKHANLVMNVFGLLILNITVYLGLYTNHGILLKFDYVGQHIPFYEQFFKLLQQGMPFWSWNQFLGTNFWSSKAYYLVGDPFAWMAYGLNFFNHSVMFSLSQIMFIKLSVGFVLFYLLLSYYSIKPLFKLLFSLTFILSGWNTTYLEHPVFTSFYTFLPLLLIGVESYLKHRSGFLMSLAVMFLVSINFYLFWPASILLLVYWLIRTTTYPTKIYFWKSSFGILAHFILGLGLSSVVWLPGIYHMMQSQRLGFQLIEYSTWSTLNVASFILFTLIPRLNYVVFVNSAGIFKDDWYYFHQISLYVGMYTLMLVPHSFYLFKSKKERILYTLVLVGSPLLLLSPKIGLFFHFTYGLRYTFIMMILWIILAAQLSEYLNQLRLKTIIFVQLAIIVAYISIYVYFIPTVYGDTLPQNLRELSLLNWALALSLVYSFVLILLQIKREKTTILLIVFVLVSVFELVHQSYPVLESHNTPYDSVKELYTDEDLDQAIEFLNTYDTGFYRVEHNIKSFEFNLTNLGLVRFLNTPDSYDSVFEYPISTFLRWYRQYPEGNWIFKFPEPTVFPLIDVKYAIMDTTQDLSLVSSYYAYPLEGGQFGKYQIYVYNQNSTLAFSYNQISNYEDMNTITQDEGIYIHDIASRMLTTLYIKDVDVNDYKTYLHSDYQPINVNPTQYNSNYMEFEFYLPQSTLMYFSIPNDPGWTITDNGKNINSLDVQGGFIGLALDEGNHQIELKFVPKGFKTGLFVTLVSSMILVIVAVLKRKVIQKQ